MEAFYRRSGEANVRAIEFDRLPRRGEGLLVNGKFHKVLAIYPPGSCHPRKNAPTIILGPYRSRHLGNDAAEYPEEA